ncbi:hypothetical protein OB905_09875 [Halobacteria archaeon AArc-dxtr1]|nr:hypothetical protein [Halobacteria archaeon AArc-dxtr1]
MRRRTAIRAIGATGAAALGTSVAGCTDAAPNGSNGENGSDENGEDGPYEPLGSVSLEGAAEAVVGDGGETAYVAGIDGIATVDVVDPASPTVLTERTDLLGDWNEDGTFTDILDVKVDGDRLAVPGPANQQGSSVFHGFVLYDVSDPADPEPVGEPYETEYPIHNCFLRDERLYVVANDEEGNPLVIFDVSGDEIEEIGRWSLLDVDPDWADVHWLLRYLHDVYVHDDLAVLAYWNAGTILLDVSDPTEPAFVSRLSETDLETQRDRSGNREAVRTAQLGLPGNDHYSAVDETGELLAIGREAWVTNQSAADRPGGIDLYDLTDSAEPEYRSTIEAPRGADERYDSEPWTTAHNFELRDDVLHASWYQGGVTLHDVSDPADPTERAQWHEPLSASFWTARVAQPGETFVASSTGYTNADRPESALYTFPIRDGEQADPVALDDPAVFEDDD